MLSKLYWSVTKLPLGIGLRGTSLVLPPFSLETRFFRQLQYDVFNAAKIQWNFLDFKPVLVGGHCIVAGLYYLSFYSKNLGVNSSLISAGRSTNEAMSEHISEKYI